MEERLVLLNCPFTLDILHNYSNIVYPQHYRKQIYHNIKDKRLLPQVRNTQTQLFGSDNCICASELRKTNEQITDFRKTNLLNRQSMCLITDGFDSQWELTILVV